VTRLLDDADEGARGGRTIEERIVAYADKRAGQRLESLDARFASWRRRYPPGVDRPVRGRAQEDRAGKQGEGWDEATFRLVRERAERLEADVCATAGIRPEEVRRLGWTARALRAATGGTVAPSRPGARAR